jgi:hypothetical protein
MRHLQTSLSDSGLAEAEYGWAFWANKYPQYQIEDLLFTDKSMGYFKSEWRRPGRRDTSEAAGNETK